MQSVLMIILPILTGERAHRGVALTWNHTIDDFITPTDAIQSDRIKCEFMNCRPLFILMFTYLQQIMSLKNLKNALIISELCMILYQLTVL